MQELELIITDIAEQGRGVGHINGLACFVKDTVPGDKVRAQVQKKKKNRIEARLIELLKPSPDRREAFCSHFELCGGCRWQHLDYTAQLRFKQKKVSETLSRISGLELPQGESVLASTRTKEYRNKLEFSFSNRRWLSHEEAKAGNSVEVPALGFHVPRYFDRVLHVDHCHLMPEPANAIRNFVHQTAQAFGFSYYDLKEHTGGLRNLTIRSTLGGQVMVLLSFGPDQKALRIPLLEEIATAFPHIHSLTYVVNTKKNDTLDGLNPLVYKGAEYLEEELDGLRFRIRPKSFFQTNPEQTGRLYALAMEMANIQAGDLVYDLYSGTGTLSLFAARKAQKVIGLEYVEDAVQDARENARANGLNNCQFHAGVMEKILDREFVEQNGMPKVLITDPPRAGMHPDVCACIKEVCAPERIVYVSCNAATQGRDLQLLGTHYQVIRYQPVDMFPHTDHVENVVLLERRP